MNAKLKELIFNEVKELQDALKFPLCAMLYDTLIIDGAEFAEKETILLCNDVLWSIYIEHFEDHSFDQKYPIPVSGTAYDWRWVIAQLVDANIYTYDESYSDDIYDIYDCISISSVSFDLDNNDEELIDLYSSIRGKTIITMPNLVRSWGYYEVLKIANVNEWPALLSIEFYTLPSKMRVLIIDRLSRQCLTYKDACHLKELLEEYVYHFKNFDILEEYPLLCRTIVEIQKYERLKHDELIKTVEAQVLELQRGNKVLNTDLIKDYLQKLIDTNIIITDKRHGFVWYAVWLFFKKKKMLKDKSQSAFEKLMAVWFPGCKYGKSDLMRRYNSDYLERNNWQIWNYDYYKKEKDKKDNTKGNKDCKKRFSQSGFNDIKNLYSVLDTYLIPKNYWIRLY